MHLKLCGCRISVHVIVITIMISERMISERRSYWSCLKRVLEVYWKFLRLQVVTVGTNHVNITAGADNPFECVHCQ